MADHPWRDHVLSVISPDAIARRLTTRIIERVLGAGFAIADGRVVHIGPAQLDAVFARDPDAVRGLYRYRILDQLFAYGPALAIVYRDADPGAGDPHRRLKLLKGATSSIDAAPGTIRADFAAINTILGLLHCSDSPADTADEAAQFLALDRPPVGDPRAVIALAHLLDAGPAQPGEFRAVLAAHRARVIAACFAELSPAARDRAGDRLGEVGAGAAIAAGLAGGAHHPAWPLLTAEWQPGMAALAPRALATGLAALGLARDAWEELVLCSSAHFAPLIREAR